MGLNKCNICDEKFQTLADLSNHKLVVHCKVNSDMNRFPKRESMDKNGATAGATVRVLQHLPRTDNARAELLHARQGAHAARGAAVVRRVPPEPGVRAGDAGARQVPLRALVASRVDRRSYCKPKLATIVSRLS